jgi:peptidoglycan/LPS O-acetylase OafA/YrhL
LSQKSFETRPIVGAKSHIPALDGLRGLAIFAVFALHYHPDETLGPWPLRLVDRASLLGWAGVSLFFVLSGFLITGILWDSLGGEHWWRNFYIRRSLRIFPLYYLVLAVVTVIAIVVGNPWKAIGKISIDFLYLTDIPGLWGEMWGSPLQAHLVHFWSLAVEEQFYLIWPFVLLAGAKNRRGVMRICVGVWLVSFAFRLSVDSLGWSWLWTHHFLLSRAGELCAGAFLSLALRDTPAVVAKILKYARVVFFLSLAALVVLILVSPGLSLMDRYWSTYGIAVLSIFSCATVAMCLRPGPIRLVFENSALRWLGKISYGIYVYHYLLFDVFQELTRRIAPNAGPLASGLLLVLVGGAGTLLISSLSFYTFERAFLALKDKLAGSSRRTVRAASAPESVVAEPR